MSRGIQREICEVDICDIRAHCLFLKSPYMSVRNGEKFVCFASVQEKTERRNQ